MQSIMPFFADDEACMTQPNFPETGSGLLISGVIPSSLAVSGIFKPISTSISNQTLKYQLIKLNPRVVVFDCIGASLDDSETYRRKKKTRIANRQLMLSAHLQLQLLLLMDHTPHQLGTREDSSDDRTCSTCSTMCCDMCCCVRTRRDAPPITRLSTCLWRANCRALRH